MTESDHLEAFAIRLHSKYCKGNHVDGNFNLCDWGYEIGSPFRFSVPVWKRPAHKLWLEKAKIAKERLIICGVEINQVLDVLDVLDEVAKND